MWEGVQIPVRRWTTLPRLTHYRSRNSLSYSPQVQPRLSAPPIQPCPWSRPDNASQSCLFAHSPGGSSLQAFPGRSEITEELFQKGLPVLIFQWVEMAPGQLPGLLPGLQPFSESSRTLARRRESLCAGTRCRGRDQHVSS